MLTDAQKKFLEVSKKFEAMKDEYKAAKEEIQGLLKEIGVGTYFQDPETALVYKVEVPSGTFVSFDPINYKRTKKDDESGSGKLAKKEAEGEGFILKK